MHESVHTYRCEGVLIRGCIDERLLVRHVLIGCISETCVNSLNGLCMKPSIPKRGGKGAWMSGERVHG